jgi:hypothetical protein
MSRILRSDPGDPNLEHLGFLERDVWDSDQVGSVQKIQYLRAMFGLHSLIIDRLRCPSMAMCPFCLYQQSLIGTTAIYARRDISHVTSTSS